MVALHYGKLCEYVFKYVCVCICVCAREREREAPPHFMSNIKTNPHFTYKSLLCAPKASWKDFCNSAFEMMNLRVTHLISYWQWSPIPCAHSRILSEWENTAYKLFSSVIMSSWVLNLIIKWHVAFFTYSVRQLIMGGLRFLHFGAHSGIYLGHLQAYMDS